MPLTPRNPSTPGKERMKGQLRRLNNLSQGIRSLQAKMRFIRDESERALDGPEEPSESGNRLLSEYGSIGADLKDLMQEWEQGKAAVATALQRHSHSRSASTNRFSIPLSPASSLGGMTAVESSPQDALKALNGVPRSSSRSSIASSNSDEQIFEATAAPRPRTLAREERLTKIREDRMRQTIEREKSQANTHMLKELETVIKLRPRGRTTGRITSI